MLFNQMLAPDTFSSSQRWGRRILWDFWQW